MQHFGMWSGVLMDWHFATTVSLVSEVIPRLHQLLEMLITCLIHPRIACTLWNWPWHFWWPTIIMYTVISDGYSFFHPFMGSSGGCLLYTTGPRSTHSRKAFFRDNTWLRGQDATHGGLIEGSPSSPSNTCPRLPWRTYLPAAVWLWSDQCYHLTALEGLPTEDVTLRSHVSVLASISTNGARSHYWGCWSSLVYQY
jgi:hypothetical protein